MNHFHANTRSDVAQTLMNYFRALDRADRPLLERCFTPDAELDYPGYFVGDATQFADFVISDICNRFERTLHCASTMVIDVQDQTAHSESYATAYHMPHGGSSIDRPFMTMWIRYIDRLVFSQEWRINRRTVVVEWVRTDASGLWQSRTPNGSRDRSDPSYRR